MKAKGKALSDTKYIWMICHHLTLRQNIVLWTEVKPRPGEAGRQPEEW